LVFYLIDNIVAVKPLRHELGGGVFFSFLFIKIQEDKNGPGACGRKEPSITINFRLIHQQTEKRGADQASQKTDAVADAGRKPG
jgi:hypothetical protein